jgi:hypothetical protein
MARYPLKKRLLKQAATNYISTHGGATATEIAYDGRTDSGKLLKNYKMSSTNPQQAYAWLRVDRDFTLRANGRFYLSKTKVY